MHLAGCSHVISAWLKFSNWHSRTMLTAHTLWTMLKPPFSKPDDKLSITYIKPIVKTHVKIHSCWVIVRSFHSMGMGLETE